MKYINTFESFDAYQARTQYFNKVESIIKSSIKDITYLKEGEEVSVTPIVDLRFNPNDSKKNRIDILSNGKINQSGGTISFDGDFWLCIGAAITPAKLFQRELYPNAKRGIRFEKKSDIELTQESINSIMSSLSRIGQYFDLTGPNLMQIETELNHIKSTGSNVTDYYSGARSKYFIIEL